MGQVEAKNYISDWYHCPLCSSVCFGYMSLASHTWQVHHLSVREFLEQYGIYKSYFGTNLRHQKGKVGIGNPSLRCHGRV